MAKGSYTTFRELLKLFRPEHVEGLYSLFFNTKKSRTTLSAGIVVLYESIMNFAIQQSIPREWI